MSILSLEDRVYVADGNAHRPVLGRMAGPAIIMLSYIIIKDSIERGL